MKKVSIEKIYSDHNRIYLTFLLVMFSVFIDVLTTLSKNLPISLGILIKGVSFAYLIFYLIFLTKSIWIRWIMLVIGMYIGIHLYLVYYYYGTAFILANLLEIIKSFYFPVLCLWIFDLSQIKAFRYESKDFVFIFLSLVLVFSLSIFTQTDLKSYDWMNGSSGWYYSSNEISAIIAAVIPIFTISIFKSKKALVRYLWAAVTVIISLVTGTRSTFFAATLWILLLIFYWIRLYQKSDSKSNKSNIILSVFMFVFLVIVYPLSPASRNQPTVVLANSKTSEMRFLMNETSPSNVLISKQSPLENATNRAGSFLNDLLKNRLYYLETNYAIFNNSDTSQKTFGIGSVITINNQVKQVQIEMDPFTILFRYGYIGFTLMLLPLFGYAFYELRALLNHRFLFDSLEYLSFGYALSLLVGLSVVAGHVIIAPSVSIFLVIIMAGLSHLRQRILNQVKDDLKIIFISSTGGHFNQLLQLKPLFANYESLIITEESPINEKIKTEYPMVLLKYGTRKQKNYIFILLFNTIKSLYIILKFRPDIVITTGTHTAVPMALIAKCYGRRLIYIESFAKRNSANLTGKLLRPFADLIVVQWESMLEVYPEAENWGWIY